MNNAAVTDMNEFKSASAIFDPAAMDRVSEQLGHSHFLGNLPEVEAALKRAVLSGRADICQTSHDCVTTDLITLYDDVTGKEAGYIEYSPKAEFFLMQERTCDPLAERKRDLLRIAAAIRKYAFRNHWCEFKCWQYHNYGSGFDLVGGEIEILAGKAEVKNCYLYEKDSEGETEKEITPEEALAFIESAETGCRECDTENTGLLKAVLSPDFDITKWYDGSELMPRLSDDRRCGRIRWDSWQAEEIIECGGTRYVMEGARKYCDKIGYCGMYQEDYARKYITDHARDFGGAEKFRIISRNFFGTRVKTYDLSGRK